MTSNTSLNTILAKLNTLASFEKTANLLDLSPLASMKQLLRALGNPEQRYKIIHIAGTNGKGQTAAIISRLLTEAGFRVGLYTSPTVLDVREGIQIDNEFIREDAFVAGGEAVLNTIEEHQEDFCPSYFDTMTAIAFYAFYQQQVDWAVIETGMGGTTDSTNTAPKEIAVITPISHDHSAFLGESLEDIAESKLGIVTHAMPVILASQQIDIKQYIIKKLQERGCTPIDSDRITITPHYPEDRYTFVFIGGETFSLSSPERRIPRPTLECIKTALTTISLIKETTLDERRRYAQAALAVSLPGRLQLCHEIKYKPSGAILPTVLFDGGHNAAALQALHEHLHVLGIKDYSLVLGMAQDKLLEHINAPLRTLCAEAGRIILCQASSARAASTDALQHFILALSRESEKKIIKAESVQDALHLVATEQVGAVIIAGSFYLLQEAFPWFELPHSVPRPNC